MSTKRRPQPSTPHQRAEALRAAGVTANEVLDAIEIELEIGTDSELAVLLGVSKATISTWRKRNSVPFDVVVYLSLTTGLDLNYSLTRRGRLSGFTKPSESIDDPTIQREILALALLDAAPIRTTKPDIERAVSVVERRRKFYRELILKEYSTAPSNFKMGNYIDFAGEVLRMLRESRFDSKRSQKNVPD